MPRVEAEKIPTGGDAGELDGEENSYFELPEPTFAGCTHGRVIDISKAFFHIDIAEESKQYLLTGYCVCHC